jgi:hypothetical protein
VAPLGPLDALTDSHFFYGLRRLGSNFPPLDFATRILDSLNSQDTWREDSELLYLYASVEEEVPTQQLIQMVLK